jgi:ribosomal protein S18 acetylase RimI-like enzyme
VRDVAAVLALWKRADAKGSLPDNAAGLRRRLARDRRLFILAWDGERLVGTVIAGWDGWRGNLYRLAVSPGSRRRGIARILVEAAETRLGKMGARRITALVLNRNRGARRFWSAAGYDRDTTIGRYVRNLH